MNNYKWLKRGIILTPFCMAATIVFGAGGHGVAFPAVILYPMMFLFNIDNDSYVWSLLLIQLPIYGLIIDWAERSENRHIFVLLLIGLHLSAVIWAAVIT
jgi:hypothetical protein